MFAATPYRVGVGRGARIVLGAGAALVTALAGLHLAGLPAGVAWLFGGIAGVAVWWWLPQGRSRG